MAKRPRKTVPEERLSPSEWQIMRICWRLGRCTVRDVLREDLKTHKRDYRTILTFMTRMTKKRWLAVEREGNVNHFYPRVDMRKALATEVRVFLERTVGEDQESRSLVWRLVSRELEKRSATPE